MRHGCKPDPDDNAHLVDICREPEKKAPDSFPSSAELT